MKILVHTPNSQEKEQTVQEVGELTKIIESYNFSHRIYFTIILQNSQYNLSQIGFCPFKEYPRIIAYNPEVIVPPEITMTAITDFEYFLSQHKYPRYFMEIGSKVFQITNNIN